VTIGVMFLYFALDIPAFETGLTCGVIIGFGSATKID